LELPLDEPLVAMHSAETLDMHLNLGGGGEMRVPCRGPRSGDGVGPRPAAFQHFPDNALSAVLSITAAREHFAECRQRCRSLELQRFCIACGFAARDHPDRGGDAVTFAPRMSSRPVDRQHPLFVVERTP
jgi:hypothetical protein